MTLRILASLVVSLMLTGPAAAQQLTGGIVGVVRDGQGGVLPGVSIAVSGDALIGGRQVVVSNESGAYQLTGLPPGMYVVAYELPGFITLQREEIRVQVAQNTRVDVELAVGGLQESITVRGGAPLVDVTRTTTQTNIDRELFDALPTSRNPWQTAALVPGVVATQLDVGGTQGMQQFNLSAYGSADSQKSFSIDGVKMNWSGGSGGSANQYYSNEMFDEYNIQTASGTAESDVSGVYINMVTKSGGNRVSGETNFLFMNSAMQSDNVDDRILGLLGAAPGTQTDAAGNPIDIMYDFSASAGGPIRRDKVWFFGSIRYFRLDQFQIGAINPDGSLGIDDNLMKVGTMKVTYQVTPNTKVSGLFIPHVRHRFHRRNAPFLAIPDQATVHNTLDTDSGVINLNQVLGDASVLNVSLGRVWGRWANLYQKDVGPNDIVVSDTVRNQRFYASPDSAVNPNERYQFSSSMTHFSDELLAGTHEFKFGFQASLDIMDWERTRNGDMQLVLRDGVASHALLSNTPNTAEHRWRTWGAYAQDSWRVGRASLNLGLRLDGASAWLPAQTSPAGLWVGERSFPKTDIYDFPFSIAPRLGVVYDLFGTGRTAVRGYYGRFYDQFGAAIPETVNPNNVSTVQVPWADLNNNGTYDPGELNLTDFVGFQAGLFPSVAQDARRPNSSEFTLGVEHQLPFDVAVSLSYHRRMLRDGLTVVDRARPASAYTPVQRTYIDQGETKTITVYNLDPALVTRRDRVISNIDEFDFASNYNGIDLTVTKKMSNNWQLLGGASFAKHEGFDHAAPFTNPGNNTDMNNPNYRLNRDAGAVFQDLPWTFKAAGSYTLPYEVLVAVNYQARAGSPLARELVVTGLRQGQERVRVQQSGVDRTETVRNFLDLRVSKRFTVRTVRLETQVDLYNMLNQNPVLSQNESIGSAWGRPQSILAPRILRLNLTMRF